MSATLLDQLNSALAILAKVPEQQLAHVRDLGVANDELALEFADISGTRRRLLAEGLLTEEQADAIGAVERQLTSITSAGPSRWTDTAIRSGDDWRRVRELAESAIRALS
jgi:hypothetical protein